MSKLKPFLDFLLFSNIFVAFAISCLAFQTFIINNSEIDPALVLFVFSSSLFAYSLHRSFALSKVPKDTELPPYHDWIRTHKKQMVLIFSVSFPVMLFCTFQLSVSHFLALLPLAIISVGYSIPVIPGKERNIRLNEIKGVKIFLISFLVSYASVIIPAVSIRQSLFVADKEILFLFAERLLFIFALAIPFDIRDLDRDKIKGIKTIPVMVGQKWAKIIGYGALVFCTGISLLHFIIGDISQQFMPPLMISIAMSAVLLFFSSPKRSEYFFSFWMDGMMVVQTIMVAFFHFR